MADLTARIKPKKSSTTGEVPQAADLEVAELAVNTADGKLFVKHTDNSIKEISGGGGAITSASDVVLSGYEPGYSWTFSSSTTYGDPGAGNFRVTTPFNIHMVLSETDANGRDATDALAAITNGDVLTVNYSGGTQAYTVQSTPSDQGAWWEFQVSTTNAPQADGETCVLETASGTLPAPDAGTAWADGDLLRYDGTNFRNTQIPLDELSDVVTYIPPASDGTWSNPNQAVDGNGNWREFADATNRQIFFDRHNDDGTDVSADYFAMQIDDTVLFSGDGTTWYQFTLEQVPTSPNAFDVLIKTNEDPSVVKTFTVLHVSRVPAVLPVDGQVLTWVAANNRWESVSTSLATLGDVDVYTASAGTWETSSYGSANGWAYQSSQYLYVNYTDKDGYDWTSDWSPYLGAGAGTFYIRNVGSSTWLSVAYTAASDSAGIHIQVNTTALASEPGFTNSGAIEFSFANPEAPPADGQVLAYVAATSKWEPADRVESNATTGGTGSNTISNIVTISQANYDALGTPDANTIYFIV